MLFIIIKNPKMQVLVMLKGFKLKTKDQREFLARKSKNKQRYVIVHE